jgi:hypothetical protein
VRYLLLCLATLCVWGEEFRVEPPDIKQGQALKVYGSTLSQTARLSNRTIRLFPQADGTSLGLMPISVLAKPATYELEWLDEHGTMLHKAEIAVANAHYRKQNVVLSKVLSALRSTSDERERVGAFLKEVSPER